MTEFVRTAFKPLLEKPENLDGQLPALDEALPIIDKLLDFWRSKGSNNLEFCGQLRWVTNIKVAFKKMQSAAADPVLSKGLHELIVSIMYTLITSPKSLLHNYPCMGLLGSVSKKLHKYTDWNRSLYKTIVDSNRLKNKAEF